VSLNGQINLSTANGAEAGFQAIGGGVGLLDSEAENDVRNGREGDDTLLGRDGDDPRTAVAGEFDRIDAALLALMAEQSSLDMDARAAFLRGRRASMIGRPRDMKT
jgi:hypothetical protein